MVNAVTALKSLNNIIFIRKGDMNYEKMGMYSMWLCL